MRSLPLHNMRCESHNNCDFMINRSEFTKKKIENELNIIRYHNLILVVAIATISPLFLMGIDSVFIYVSPPPTSKYGALQTSVPDFNGFVNVSYVMNT